MVEHYTALAPVYDAIGMSRVARQMVPAMLDYAQRNDWAGRQILELGCGTGEGIITLADSGFALTGVDIAPEMLKVATEKTQSVTWQQADIRQMSDEIGQQDLIVAVDVMNELEDIREMQTAFKLAYEKLKPGKPFLFDLHTIAGLTRRGTAGDEIFHDANGITVFVSNEYDYERQAATRNHMTFQRDESGVWNRLDTYRIVRGYPLQAVAALLQKRVGFDEVAVLTMAFQPYDGRATVDRVVVVAFKM